MVEPAIVENTKGHKGHIVSSNSQVKSHAVKEDIVANARIGIFHRVYCQYVSRMNPTNIVNYSLRNDVVDDGYRPCKKCRP